LELGTIDFGSLDEQDASVIAQESEIPQCPPALL